MKVFGGRCSDATRVGASSTRSGKRVTWFTVVSPLVAILLAGCAATPRANRADSLPTWMSRYPTNPEYFIGVGGSPDTGDRQGDLERARANALAQLASEIEVTIRSDQTYRETATSSGDSSTTVDIIVRTLTAQNLEGVETVDSFHSDKEGYWFYFRLSKATWDQIKNREMYELRDRVLAMIGAVANPTSSVSERLRTYSFALELLGKSKYGGKIPIELEGTHGVLDDLVSTQLGAMLDRLHVTVDPPSIRFPPGRPAELRIRVASTENRPIGALAMEVRGPRGETLAELATGSDGSYGGALGIAGLRSGKRLCSVGLAPAAIKGADKPLLARAPQAQLEIEVLPLGVHLLLDGPETLDRRWLTDSVTSILTEDYALAVLRSDDPTPFLISVTVRGRSSPPNEYGIEFAYCSLSMTMARDDSKIAALTTAEAKGAGTTADQAIRKAAAEMLKDLPQDSALEDAVGMLVANAWMKDSRK